MKTQREGTLEEVRDDHFKISPTAKLVAYFRTFSDIPYSEYIAQQIGAKEVAAELVGGEDNLKRVIWAAPLLESRYKCINDHLSRLGIRNVLELASGIAPRGIVMTQDPSVTYVETDLNGMFEEKRKLILELRDHYLIPSRPNLHFEEVNTLKTEDLEKAKSHFSGKPFAVVHEGLLPYLPREEKQVMANNLYSILEPEGAWITPDISSKHVMEAILKQDPKLIEFVGKISGVTGRDLINNAFEDENDAMQFYNNSGFNIEIYPGFNGELSSTTNLGLDKEKISKMLKSRKVWVMKKK